MRGRRRQSERQRLVMPYGRDGMIGGEPDELAIDRRADGRYNFDSYFRAENLEHRLVLTRKQLGELASLARDAL